MTTATLTLSEFLLARLAEDEAAAKAAAEKDPPPWTVGPSAGGGEQDGLFNGTSRERTIPAWGDRSERTVVEYDPVFTFDSGFGGAAFGWDETVTHIARHDPARVLAECAAKRRILQEYDWGYRTENEAGLGIALRLLAQPYADHADYREEWRA